MSFFVRRPSSTSRRAYTHLDLFQLVQLNYRQSASELCYASNIELMADYCGVATNQNAFQAACWISQFTLANLLPHIAMPQYFTALRVAFIRLMGGRPCPHAVLTGLALTYLHEAGWLNLSRLSVTEAAQCELLLQMAQGGDFPGLSVETWDALWEWTRGELARADVIGKPVFEVAAAAGMTASKGEARRLAQQGGLFLNSEKAPLDRTVAESDLVEGRLAILRSGKKNYFVLRTK